MTTQPALITLIGGPTALVRFAGLTVLTDPTFDPPGDYTVGLRARSKLRGPAVAASELPPIDAVLLSHDTHIDNLDREGRQFLSSTPLVLSTPAAAENIPGVVGLAPWESSTIEADVAVTVTAVPALHGPPEVELAVGPVTGFVLEADGFATTYVSGDNASLRLVAEIAERFAEIEVAIVFLGAARVPSLTEGILTLDARGAVELAGHLPRATVVPIHAEGWSHYSESRADIAPAFEAAGIANRVVILPLGVEVEVGGVRAG